MPRVAVIKCTASKLGEFVRQIFCSKPEVVEKPVGEVVEELLEEGFKVSVEKLDPDQLQILKETRMLHEDVDYLVHARK